MSKNRAKNLRPARDRSSSVESANSIFIAVARIQSINDKIGLDDLIEVRFCKAGAFFVAVSVFNSVTGNFRAAIILGSFPGEFDELRASSDGFKVSWRLNRITADDLRCLLGPLRRTSSVDRANSELVSESSCKIRNLKVRLLDDGVIGLCPLESVAVLLQCASRAMAMSRL